LKKTSRVDEGGVNADAAAIVKSPDNGLLAEGDGLIGWGQDSSSDQSAGPVLEVDTKRPTGLTPATLLSAFGKSQSKHLNNRASRASERQAPGAAACAFPLLRKNPARHLPCLFNSWPLCDLDDHRSLTMGSGIKLLNRGAAGGGCAFSKSY
jgi:hypothetical protein